MKLTKTYVVGKLELIAQQEGKIIVRILCDKKTKVYGDRELDLPFGKIYGKFSKKEINLSHPLKFFKEGDKVKLSCIPGEHDENDKFSLENLTLSESSCTLEEAFSPEGSPTVPGKKLFGIDVCGTLELFKKGYGKVALRLKCHEKKYVFFDEDNNQTKKTHVIDKTVYAEIPIEKLRYDINLLFISYKEGDSVTLSGMVNDDTFDLDNTTLSLYYAKPNYTSKWDL